MGKLLTSTMLSASLIFLFASQLFAANWYLSTSASGNGSGSSWANAALYSSFNLASVNAGDVIYFDGGASGLTYGEWSISRDGSSGSRITITKGVDAGHNGDITFAGSGTNTLDISGDYLTFDNIRVDASAQSSGNRAVYIHDNTGTVFQNCYISCPGQQGFRIASANNWRVTKSTITTGIVSNSSNPDCFHIDNSAGGSMGYNMEIDSCTIIMVNNNASNGNHKDAIQTYMWQIGTGGVSKIHHNFIYVYTATGQALTPFELSAIGGDWEIYNNVIVYGTGSGTGRAMYLGNCDSEGGEGVEFSARIYNNTFHIADDRHWAMAFYDTDTLIVKNNLVYAPSIGTYQTIQLDVTTLSNYYDVNYNQYRTSDLSTFLGRMVCNTSETSDHFTSYWQGVLDQDLNGEAFASGTPFDFVGGSLPSLTAGDYALEGSSSGIDEGTSSVGGLFTNDFNGNTRTGTWDVGAFEFGTASVDSVPTFSFTPVTGRELNTEYIATSPITGVDTVSHFWTTTAAEFKINYNGTYSTAMKTADPDNGADTIYVKNTSSGSYSTMTAETIVGGGNSQSFNVTTKAATPSGNEAILKDSSGKIIKDSTGKIIKVK